MGIQCSLVNLVVFTSTVFTSEYCMGYRFHWWLWRVQYSLRGTLFTSEYVGYDIHWDTGFTLTPAIESGRVIAWKAIMTV